MNNDVDAVQRFAHGACVEDIAFDQTNASVFPKLRCVPQRITPEIVEKDDLGVVEKALGKVRSYKARTTGDENAIQKRSLCIISLD
jgi:hypothetical protein